MSYDNFPKITQTFSKRDSTDISDAVMRMRLIKSPAEQEVFRQGARIADLACEAAKEAVEQGTLNRA